MWTRPFKRTVPADASAHVWTSKAISDLDDRDTLPVGSIAWRIGHRHYLDVLYFKLARDGTDTIDRTISFRDRTFESQVTLNSSFDTETCESQRCAISSALRRLLRGSRSALTR